MIGYQASRGHIHHTDDGKCVYKDNKVHPTQGASRKLRQEKKNDKAYHALLGSFWYANVNLQRDARKASRGSTAYNTPQAYRNSQRQFMSWTYTTSRNQVSSVEASPFMFINYK